MNKTLIFTNPYVIKRNLKQTVKEPPLVIKTCKSFDHGMSVDVLDKDGDVVGTFIYNPDECGAKVWFETENEVVIHEKRTGPADKS